MRYCDDDGLVRQSALDVEVEESLVGGRYFVGVESRLDFKVSGSGLEHSPQVAGVEVPTELEVAAVDLEDVSCFPSSHRH